jgi:hypothetical protein
MNHPLNELTTKNGQIFRKTGVTLVSYMNTPPIEIVAKDGCLPVSEREYCFNFRLNHHPDAFWEKILANQLENFQVEVDGSVLEMTTIPPSLKSRYDAIQKAIAKTNQVYGKHRQNLIVAIQENEKQQAAKAKWTQQSQQQAQQMFDELKL